MVILILLMFPITGMEVCVHHHNIVWDLFQFDRAWIYPLISAELRTDPFKELAYRLGSAFGTDDAYPVFI